NHPIAFTLKINHRGTLTSPPNVCYRGGKANWFDDVDVDDIGLKPLSCDKVIRIITLIKDRPSGSKARVSGSNTGKTPMVIEEVDRTYSSVASEDSDDSDFDVGEEDRIEDVEVDMADFRKHTNGNVEWVGCNEEEVQVAPLFDYEEVDLEYFASETESGDNECERKKALKKLAKNIGQ
ncbi:hypothetical protein Tco_0962811, partial [Tanacetum coccineum]